MSVSEDRAERARRALEKVRARTERAYQSVHGKRPRFGTGKAGTIAEAAAYLECSEVKIRAYIARGLIRTVLWDGELVFTEDVIALHEGVVQADEGANGLCTVCEQDCAACKRVKARALGSYVGLYPGARDIDITEDDAAIMLGCPGWQVEIYIRRGQLIVNQNKTYCISWKSVARLKRKLAIEQVDRDATLSAIVDQVQILATRRNEAHSIIDEWLRELSLLPVESGIRFGRRVTLGEPPRSGWYVYHLCYPDGQPFYIGKGRGQRIYQHAAEARKGKESYKCNTIRSLWRRGQDICYRVVFVSSSESEAYAIERAEIAAVGLANLTNMQEGGMSAKEAGRLMGFTVPPEYLDAGRFVQYLHWHNSWRRATEDEVKSALQHWSYDRTRLLQWLLCLAQDVRYESAQTILKAELDALGFIRARQIDMFDALERYRLTRSGKGRSMPGPWWDAYAKARKYKASLPPRPHRSRIADQLPLDDEV
jgi:hypothetical protein